MNTILLANDAKTEVVGEGVSRRILSFNETIMGVEVHFDTASVGAVHSHPHTQLTYVLEGSFEFTVDGKIVPVSKGDSLIFESEVKHGVVCKEKGVLLDVFTPYREDFVK